MIARLSNKDIYDGCLNYLKSELTDELPEGFAWNTDSDSSLSFHGIKNLVGNPTPVNEHPYPYDKQHYIRIFFGNHFIQPISYSLMGRRIEMFNGSYLKNWIFYGLTRFDEWVPIHMSSPSDPPFSFAEIRTFPLKKKESYKGFMINMTEKNTNGDWGICLGQIDVHGFVFDKYKVFSLCTVYFQRFNFRFSILFYLFTQFSI